MVDRSNARPAGMKRKLDDDDVPTPVAEAHTNPSFGSFGLDTRLLQAIYKQGFSSPTSVQSKVIPLALEGKDLLGESMRASLYQIRLTMSNQSDQRQVQERHWHTFHRSSNLYFDTKPYEHSDTYI